MMSNSSSSSNAHSQIVPTGMPFSTSFLGDNFFKFPVTLAMIGLYMYMVAVRKTHQFRHFTLFHLTMYTNVFFLILWQILPIFWKFLEPIAFFFWFAFLSIFYLGMINQILLNFVFCQSIFLFISDIDSREQRSKWDVGREKLVFAGSIVLLAVEIVLEVVFKFHFTLFGRLYEIDIPIIISHLLIISLLSGWFWWWIKTGRQAKLSQQQICNMIQSILFITVSTLALLINSISGLSSQDPTETVHVTLSMGSLLILPFLWVLSALLADLPRIPHFFYPKETPIVEFSMS